MSGELAYLRCLVLYDYDGALGQLRLTLLIVVSDAYASMPMDDDLNASLANMLDKLDVLGVLNYTISAPSICVCLRSSKYNGSRINTAQIHRDPCRVCRNPWKAWVHAGQLHGPFAHQ